MPKPGVSTDSLADLENDIARILTAREHVERLRALGRVLVQRNVITPAYAADLGDSLDYIIGALLTGKRNTARLRGGW